MRRRLTHCARLVALIPPFLYSFSPLAPPRQDGEGVGGGEVARGGRECYINTG